MIKITKEQFLAYERVRKSGITNMFNTKMVRRYSGLTREQVLEITASYYNLSDKYLKH